MQPDQRRLAAERADHQRDMLLPVVGRAEGDDLRIGQAVEREPGAGDQIDLGRRRSMSATEIAVDAGAGSTSHSAGSSPALRASATAAAAALAQSAASG